MPERDIRIDEAVQTFSLRGAELFPVSQGVATAHVASIDQLGDFLDSERDYSVQYSRTSALAVGTSPAAVTWQQKDFDFPAGGWTAASVVDVAPPVPGWYLTVANLKVVTGGADRIWTAKLVFRLSGVNTDTTVRTFVLGSGGNPTTGDWLTLWMVRYWTTSETARLLMQSDTTGSSIDIGSFVQMVLLSRDE